VDFVHSNDDVVWTVAARWVLIFDATNNHHRRCAFYQNPAKDHGLACYSKSQQAKTGAAIDFVISISPIVSTANV